MRYSFKDIIQAFMLDRPYRLARKILGLFLLAIITLSMILDNISYLGSTDYIFWTLSIYTFAVYSLILGNVYILIPRFLLKNQFIHYFISVFLLIVFLLSILAGLQLHILPDGEIMEGMPSHFIFLNLIASFVSMGFMVIGSTAVSLFRYWMESNRRIHQLEAATLESELELLKQQINPHFLFNMLNNVNVLIWRNPDEAKDILTRLEALLRYQLNEKEKQKVSLCSDIHFLNDFLNLEKIRRDKFIFTITQEGDPGSVWVPSLLFIPFVENAVKHNPDSQQESFVHLFFGVKDQELLFRCENSKPAGMVVRQGVGGIGLKNIQRRLTLLYPGRHSLEITDLETNYIVTLRLTL